MSKKKTPREALQSYAPGQGGPTSNTVDRYYEPSRRTPGALIDMLNRGNAPRGLDLPDFAINRNRMLQEEAQREALYRADNMQPVELPEAAPIPQASLAQMLMGQYDPVAAPQLSAMLRAKSMASERGQKRMAGKMAEDLAFAAERNRIDNAEMPAEIGSPGYKGRAFDAFQYLIGRKRAL